MGETFIKPKLILLCLLSILAGIEFAASVQAQTVCATAGGYFENNSGSLSFTVGEAAIESYYAANGILTQGFHQTSLIHSSVGENKTSDYQVFLFPNPVSDILFLTITNQGDKPVGYKLFDVSGKLINELRQLSDNTIIDLSNLPSGTYILTVLKGKRNSKTFKIIKK